MKKFNRFILLVYVFMAVIPGALSAQDHTTAAQKQYRSGFDPYVFITHSPDLPVSAQVDTEIHANVPFYIGIQLPPLLARHKDFSTDYAIDLQYSGPMVRSFCREINIFHQQKRFLKRACSDL